MATVLESLIAAVQDATQGLDSLIRSHRQLSNIIDQEHDAIGSSDLNRLEKITEAKNNLFTEISLSVSRFNKAVEDLIYYLKELNVAVARDLEVKQLFSSLADGIDEVVQNRFDKDLLIHEIGKLNNSFTNLENLHHRSQPKIEMNRYLITKLLEQHRETYRFWQSLAIEAESTYGSTGSSNKQKITPSLTVRT